jgi:hypothetical protein
MEHPDPKTKWQNMRRMAWLGVISALIFPFMIIYKPALLDIATTFYTFWAAVIGSYMGFSTWRDGWGQK